MKNKDDYLWDRSGEPDPELRELERVMGSLGQGKTTAPRRPPLLRQLLIFVAAAAMLILAFVFSTEPYRGEALISGTWIRTAEEQRTLQVPTLGEFSLWPDTELQVQTMSDELAKLYLLRGRMSAFVYPDVPARFFQVNTPAALCVDLGCQYELTVEANGNTFVRVSLGQIAFENGERSVYVPTGAACRANPENGAGLPFFENSSGDLRQSVDAFDRASFAGQDRRPLAREIMKHATREKDSLTLFHLLSDPDSSIALAAQQRLVELVKPPQGLSAQQLESSPDDHIRSLWYEELELLWY